MNFALCRQIVFLGFLFSAVYVDAQQLTSLVEEVVVVAHPLSAEGLSQAVDVLEGKELERKLASNIGATLAKQPGIHSAPFGSAVGRPVIHGLSGPRVRIMEDRIDTLDVSVTSGDHAVGVEPFIAQRIEVVKGASTLLYGSGAIGGVVDVHTGRIPHQLPDNGFSGGIETRVDNNSHGHTTAVKLNGGSGHFAWHLDGTLKDGDDYTIPGFAESARIRAAEPADGDEDEVRGYLPGSEFNTKAAAGGASYLDHWGFVGLSVSALEADYGLPGGHNHAADNGTPTLQLEQTRTDFELGIKHPFTGVSSINLRLGVNDYEHQEVEPTGEVATRFFNKAWESRVEVVYEASSWTSAFGLQHSDKQFSAFGEEAFIQPVDTVDSGVFWVGERSFDVFDLETGIRLGYLQHDPDAGSSKDFTSYAASIGAVIPAAGGWQLGLVIDYSSRAPVAEELFSAGPHLVTRTFERGNTALENEHAINLSASVQYADKLWSASATGYYTQFYDFIYQQATGAEEDGLPVVAYLQDDARFFGTDLEVSIKLAMWDDAEVSLKGVFDYVNAKLDVRGNDHIPRTPPMRFGLGLDTRWGRFSGSIDYLRVHKQNNVAELELKTAAYNDLSAYLEYQLPVANAVSLSCFLQGKNLTDDEQRVHTSFIKEFAPSPGRTLEMGLRLVF